MNNSGEVVIIETRLDAKLLGNINREFITLQSLGIIYIIGMVQLALLDIQLQGQLLLISAISCGIIELGRYRGRQRNNK